MSKATDKPFVTWCEGERQFLASKNKGTFWFICDDTGAFWGARRDIDEFRREYANKETLPIASVVNVIIRGGRDPLTLQQLE